MTDIILLNASGVFSFILCLEDVVLRLWRLLGPKGVQSRRSSNRIRVSRGSQLQYEFLGGYQIFAETSPNPTEQKLTSPPILRQN